MALRTPSTYIKKLWLDTVCYDEDVMLSSYSYLGCDKMLLGTDYPHQISKMENAVGRAKKLNIAEQEKNTILGENALKLLKL